MAEIIGVDSKKRKRYGEIMARLGELDRILGYARDADGMSLSRRAMEDILPSNGYRPDIW